MGIEQTPLVRIVDDEESVRRSERFVFAIIGLETACYESAEEFLEKDDPGRPGCLILDLRMKGMSGLELQQAMLEAGNELPVIFLSGHGTVNTAVFALKRGACDFLEKPVRPEKLQAIAKAMIERDLENRKKKAARENLRARYEALTDREREVLLLVAQDRMNKQIASELGIAEHTVKIHRGNALYKMQIRSAIEAHDAMASLGLLDKGPCESGKEGGSGRP